jgi:hypothetical protein
MDPTFAAFLRLGWALYQVGRYRFLVAHGDRYIASRLARVALDDGTNCASHWPTEALVVTDCEALAA